MAAPGTTLPAMIEYPIYKLIHLTGLFILFTGFGLYFAGAPKKTAGMMHGIGIFIVLLGGFGMLARLGIHWPWPGWIVGKLIVLVILGASITLIKRGLLPRGLLYPLIIGLGSLAVWLVIWKPI